MWRALRQSATLTWQGVRWNSLKAAGELAFKKKLQEVEAERAKNAPFWEIREASLRKRYGQWNPTHKLSRQQMNDIRDLKTRAPQLKTVQIADFFGVNPESIRRILKSKWVPNDTDLARLERRAEERKQASRERRKLEKEALQRATQGFSLPTAPRRPPHHKLRNGQSQGSGPNPPRIRTPFTRSIGDLIE